MEGSEIGACRAEYQSFVQEQRQLERCSARSRLDVSDTLSFCSSQVGFRARLHLFKVCILTKNGKALRPFEPEITHLAFLGVPANSSHCTRASNFRLNNRHQSAACHDLRGCSAWCSALRA